MTKKGESKSQAHRSADYRDRKLNGPDAQAFLASRAKAAKRCRDMKKLLQSLPPVSQERLLVAKMIVDNQANETQTLCEFGDRTRKRLAEKLPPCQESAKRQKLPKQTPFEVIDLVSSEDDDDDSSASDVSPPIAPRQKR